MDMTKRVVLHSLLLAAAAGAALTGVDAQRVSIEAQTPAQPPQFNASDDRDHDRNRRHDDDDRREDDRHDRRHDRRTTSTHSSPIAITSDDRNVWSVNPDNDSVSLFNVTHDQNLRVAEVTVGKEPWCLAITPDDEKVYVTNMASGTVSVIRAATRKVIDTIAVGTEPFGCALTPDGRRLYVSNQSSNTVSVIDTGKDRVVTTIEGVGEKPHGIAVSEDGRKVYVTQFLAQTPVNDPRPLTRSEGADDGREGRVTVIDARDNEVIDTVVLSPLADVGAAFRSDGNTLAREPLTQVFDNVSGAFPNLLESVFVRGDIAYVPGTCSSPNGPFRFNVNVQGCLSTVDTRRDVEAAKTLNMNVGVNFEPVGRKIFNTNPFAIAFKRGSAEGFVVLGATDRLLRVTLDANGLPTINPPLNAADPGAIVRIELKDPQEILLADDEDRIGGKNPRGITINSSDTRAYVMDFVSRDVAVVDISGDVPTLYHTLARIQSAAPPAAGSVAAIVHRGKQLFNSAIGPVGEQPNSVRPAGRMSDTGWGTCYSCHPNALTDSVTWMFADGPRQAISMEGTFEFGAATIVNGAPALPESHQRALNWSAVRDEPQDFSRNIRAVSGGGGLVIGVPEGAAGLAQVPDLTPVANTGRSADLDAIATYLALGVRAPISPLSSHSRGVRQGRRLFEEAGCQNCHGGPNWTISSLDSTPPPAANEIVDAQLVKFLCRVGTFDPALFADGVSNEIRANNAANVQARGALGFNVPSLVSVFASAPYLHSGAAATLAAVLDNVTHRTVGRADGLDVLTDAQDRHRLVRFLTSIDRDTQPFLNVSPPVNACGPQ
jgi:YVTN family beta-propeller protein